MIGQALALGRRLADARMSETVTAGVFTDGTDPVTGDPIRVLGSERYAGKARVKYTSLNVSTSEGTGSPVGTQTPYLSIPTGSPRLFEGDGVLVSASAHDPLLAGRVFTIAGAPEAGQTTSNRYPLTETT